MDDLKKQYRGALFIALSMFACLFIYAALVEFLRTGPNAPTPQNGPQMDLIRMILFAAAALSAVASFLVKKLILAGASGKTAPGPKLLGATVVSFALCESLAIYGLVLFFLTGGTLDFFILLGCSFILFVLNFPRYSSWEEYAHGGQADSTGLGKIEP